MLEAYRAKYDDRSGRGRRGRLRGRAGPPEEAVEEVGSIDDQAALKDWLHENSVETILEQAGGRRDKEQGAPEQAFLLAQWQGGDEEIVLPEEVGDVRRDDRQPQARVVGTTNDPSRLDRSRPG